MILHITSVAYLEDYRLRIEFNDGSVKEVDLRHELWGEVFEPLKDMEMFKQVALNPLSGTIEWPNGADLAPEYLQTIGKEIKKIA